MANRNAYMYPDKLSWFDSERRQRFGSYYDFNEGRPYARYDSTDPTYIQTFYIDGTDTDYDHRKSVTLTTLANGVSVVLEYYVVEDGSALYPPDHVFRVYGNARVLDKRGHLITDPETSRSYDQSVTFTSNAQYSSMNSVKLQYISSEIGYSASGEMAYINMFGTLFGPRWNTDPSKIGLGGNISPDELQDLYSTHSLFTTQTWNDYDHIMDVITDSGDGTPIRPIYPEDDPSEPSPVGPPGYDPNPTPEPVPFPDIPSGGDAMSTGFIKVYSPTSSELRSLSAQLWSDDFYNTIKKIQNDPMEAIISLHNIPFSPRNGVANCVIGNYNTNVLMGVVTQQWHKRNLGSIYIPENWSSALDYAPYVQVDCFIPYVGVRSLQVDDIIGKNISIEMTVDVVSGAGIAHVKCNGAVLYTYNTSLSGEIPISQSSYAPMYNSIVGAMGNVLSGYGSAGAPGAVGAVIGSGINVALSKQHSISRSGSIGGNTGCMGVFTPYLIIHRPIQSLASGFAHFKGYPSNITDTIGSVSGYTEVESVHLNGISCTENERAEIEALLYNGVIV